ncbi:MAG: hypothetical protein D6790_20130, partial [Caldilineae bacterium]
MIHLTSVVRRASFPKRRDQFPFNVPAVSTWDALTFDAPVTFLVGENGSGKSTFLEMLAVAANLPTVGAEEVARDNTMAHARALAKHFRLTWATRNHRGFFLRAEDFFGFAKRMASMQADLEADLAAVEEEYAGRSEHAKGLARMPFARELAA